MKVKLFVLAALVLLSSITGIFNNIPIDVSAQEYEEIDDNGSNGDNGMGESYSYDDSSTYNTDDGYNNNYDPSTEEQDSEYSTYNSYEPASYGTGDEVEYSSYDNYEYLYSEYLQDDYSSETSSSYEKYNNNDYSYEDSYNKNYYPPKDPKTFTCPGSGLVVDKQEHCPVVCPAGTTLEGHLVKSGSDLQKVCNENTQELEVCGASTDLAGVFVSNAPVDCNIFATCGATDPLGQALGLTETQTVEVADPQLCRLAVPSEFVLEQCNTGPMTGALVTDERLCQAPNNANLCTSGDLVGVYVNNPTTDCEIDYPTCDANTPLGQALELGTGETVEVVDAQLCNLVVPEEVTLTECTTGPMTGALVTDDLLCQAPNNANLCTSGDLVGVYVNNPTTDCDIDTEITTNPEAQCLKCADLAALQGSNSVPTGQNAQLQASIDLIGDNSTDTNVFTICDDPQTAQTEFNFTITIAGNPGQANPEENRIQNAFKLCMNNAAAQTTTVEAQTSTLQAQVSSLQEDSLITNVKPENEIPSLSMLPLPKFIPPY